MARVLELHSIHADDSDESLRVKLQSNMERLQRMADALFNETGESWSPVSKDGLANVKGNLHLVDGELRISSGGVRGQNEGGIRRTYGGNGAWLEYSHDGETWYKFAKGDIANGVVPVYSPNIGGPIFTAPPGSSFGVGCLFSSRTVTASTTMLTTDDVIRVNATTGDMTVTMMSPATEVDRVFYVKKIDATANKVTVDGGAFNIDAATSVDLTIPWQTIVLHSITTGWELLPGY